MAEVNTTVETTTESAELAELREELARIKRSNDDLSKENANYKRQERARMSEDEQKQVEAQERDRKYAELEKKLAMRDFADELSGIGDKKSIDKIVGLLADGETLSALKELKVLITKSHAEIETRVRDELMQKNPQPSPEGGKSSLTREEILRIADTAERQKAIAENIDLFR